MKHWMLPVVLAALASGGVEQIQANLNQGVDDVFAGLDEGLSDDAVVLGLIGDAVQLIQDRSAPGSKWDDGLERKLRRTHLAIRLAAERKLLSARWDLVATVNACDGGEWSGLALEAYGAIESLGGAHTYLIGEVHKVNEHPHRAASALMLLGANPSEEINGIVQACKKLCRAAGNDDALQVIIRASGPVQLAYDLKSLVGTWDASGEESKADKELLITALSSYVDRAHRSYWLGASRIYIPAAMYAKQELGRRMKTNLPRVQAALESLTWHEIRRCPTTAELPEWHEKVVEECKEQLVGMFPGLAN